VTSIGTGKKHISAFRFLYDLKKSFSVSSSLIFELEFDFPRKSNAQLAWSIRVLGL